MRCREWEVKVLPALAVETVGPVEKLQLQKVLLKL